MNTVETPAQPALHVGARLLARNTLLNLIGRVVPLLVGVAAMPYVIRHLGPDRFGLLSLAWMVVGYFAIFNLGIGPATTKFVAELLGKGETDKLPQLVWTAVISQTCFGLAAGALLAAASPLIVSRLLKIPADLHPQARLIFLIMAAALPVDFSLGSFSGVLAASQRFDLLTALGIPSSALTYLLPAGALALGFGLPLIVFLLVLARVAGAAILLVLCLRLYPQLRRLRFERRLVRQLLGYGGWVTVSSAVGPILVFFDRFLIGALVSVAAVGFYTPPYMISTKLWILPHSLMATLFPAFSASAGRGDFAWIRNALIRSLKFVLLTVGPAALLLMFFARPLLTLWVGARFAAEGTLVLRVMAAGVLANSLAFVASQLLYGIGRPDVCTAFHLMQVPPYVFLMWFLAVHYGLSGVAIAWTARMVGEFVIFVAAACRLTRTPARLLAGRELRRTVATLLALAAALFALWGSTRVFVADAALALLFGAGFLLAAWRYVLAPEERCELRLWFRIAR
jgi:O-antigen/teichoic acid export membrane protein